MTVHAHVRQLRTVREPAAYGVSRYVTKDRSGTSWTSFAVSPGLLTIRVLGGAQSF